MAIQPPCFLAIFQECCHLLHHLTQSINPSFLVIFFAETTFRDTQLCRFRINNRKLVHNFNRLSEGNVVWHIHHSLLIFEIGVFELPKCGGQIWIFLQVMLLITVKLLLLPQLKYDRWNQGAQTVAVAPISKELCTHPMPLHHRTAPEKSLLLLNLCCAPVDSDENPETKSSLWLAERNSTKENVKKSNRNRCCFFHKISQLLVNFWIILTNNILEQIFGGGGIEKGRGLTNNSDWRLGGIPCMFICTKTIFHPTPCTFILSPHLFVKQTDYHWIELPLKDRQYLLFLLRRPTLGCGLVEKINVTCYCVIFNTRLLTNWIAL